MRFLVFLIIALLVAYFVWPEPEPVPVEETFIGEQIKPLRKVEGFEDDYLKATEAKKQRIEEQLEEDGS